jgi:hypothetical protein
VTGTEIFKSYNNSDILLLKKKHPTDNLSKDLIVSGNTLEEIPSLQNMQGGEPHRLLEVQSNVVLRSSFHRSL